MRPTPAALWLIALLSAWLGAAVFSTLVAQAAFAVLPTRTLAGALVGRVLPQVFIVGTALGAATLTSAAMVGAGWAVRIPAIAMGAACAVAQFVIAPRIESVRAAIGGPVEALDLIDPRRQEFGRLHGMSVLCLGIAAVSALGVVGMLARTVVRSSSLVQAVPTMHAASEIAVDS